MPLAYQGDDDNALSALIEELELSPLEIDGGATRVAIDALATREAVALDYQGSDRNAIDALYDLLAATGDTYQLDAEEAELIAASLDGRFTLSNGNLTVAHTMTENEETALGAWPANTLTGEGASIDTTDAIVGWRWNIDSLPVHVSDRIAVLLFFTSFDPSFDDTCTALLRTEADGSVYLGTQGATAEPDSWTLPGVPEWIGVYFNGTTLQWGLIVDGTDYGYMGPYTSTERIAAINGTFNVPAEYDAETVQATLVLDAASMGAGWPAGTVDITGVEV